jgi:subtilisin family serine protease
MLTRRWRVRAAVLTLGVAATSGTGLLATVPARADVVQSAEQWVINELNLRPAWAHTQGSGVTVAVIDSGVDPNVSDLLGSVITGPDFSGVDTPPANPNWGVHGTWMASLVAGHGHDGGTAGILGAAPKSEVLSIRVITDAGDPNYARYQAESATQGQHELAEAITYAVAHHAGVISLSLGYSAPSRAVRNALQDAYDHNVVVVASAGNSGTTAGATGTGQAPFSFPADYPGVLGVAAVNSSGQVASFSSENLSVQVAAPGDRVPAQGNDGGYWYVSGTSPACALTAGVVALIKSAYPKLTDSQVISAITSSTTPSTRPAGGWDEQIGFGEVNAGRALTAAAQLAAAGQPAAGVAASSHFGGGPEAVPPPPVAPRGPGALIGYGLLAVACLGLVAFAASRLLTQGGSGYPAPAEAGAAWPGGPTWPDPTRPSGPTRPGGVSWLSGTAGAGNLARQADAGAAPGMGGARPDVTSGPAGRGTSERPPAGPPAIRPPLWPPGSSPPPRHAAPRGRGAGDPERP